MLDTGEKQTAEKTTGTFHSGVRRARVEFVCTKWHFVVCCGPKLGRITTKCRSQRQMGVKRKRAHGRNNNRQRTLHRRPELADKETTTQATNKLLANTIIEQPGSVALAPRNWPVKRSFTHARARARVPLMDWESLCRRSCACSSRLLIW